MLLVDLASLLFAFFIFPCRPFHIPPPLPFKGGWGFLFISYQQLIQAIAGDSGHGLARNEKLDMYVDIRERGEKTLTWSSGPPTRQYHAQRMFCYKSSHDGSLT